MTTFPHTYLFKQVGQMTVLKKRARGLCVSHGCRRVAEMQKTRCPTCRSRLYRLNNDCRYAYSNLRASARKRGIAFELAYGDFEEFCATTGYLELRGKEDHSLSIDRIDRTKGYVLGNLRPLNYLDNVTHRYE